MFKTATDLRLATHRTYHPNTYYLNYQLLPKPWQKLLNEAAVEVKTSRYTFDYPMAFIRTQTTLDDGTEVELEISLGAVPQFYGPEFGWGCDGDGVDVETGGDCAGCPACCDALADDYNDSLADEMRACIDWEHYDVYIALI